MPTFLFLHTEAPTREVLRRHRPGRMVLASDEVSAEDRTAYDACVRLPPAYRVEESLRVLRDVPADRVVVQTEYGLLAGSLLAGERGSPAPTPRAAFLCTNKWLQRRALERAGVPVPRFALASSAGEVRRLDLGWPRVLKPVASTLGRYVVRVDRDEDLDAAVASLLQALPDAPDVRRCVAFARLAGLDLGCDPFRQFLVEAYADGPPQEVDGLVFGDRIVPFGVTEQVVSAVAGPRFYLEGYLFPSPRPGRLPEIAEAAVRALGLTDAGFSIEFRGDAVIEVNGRLGEDAGFPDLFAAGIGKPPILKWIEGDSAPCVVRGGHALAYAARYAPGVVRSVSSGDGAVPLVRVGDRVAVPGTPEFAPHLAWSLRSDPRGSREAYAAARRVVDAVHVEFA